jgi:hypothetical protein
MGYRLGKLRIGGFQVGEQPMDPEQIQVVENLVHTIMLRLGFTRLDLWSDKLEGLSFIDLHLTLVSAKRTERQGSKKDQIEHLESEP